MERRPFLKASLAAAVAPFLPAPAVAIEPLKRQSQAPLKLSLAAYSFRQWLDLKKPTQQPNWTLMDFIQFAADQGTDAVELTGYYFKETTPEYLSQLKLAASKAGLDISGTAVGNDFCLADPAKLAEQKKLVKDFVEHTSRLGGKTIRIFAGKLAKGQEEKSAVKQAVEAIHECCDHAAKYGVYLALENHGGITAEASQLLAIVQAVKHDYFAVNLDTGNFRTDDPYGDLAKLAPYAVNVQVKTEIQPKGKPKEEADLPRLMKMLKMVNYRGYVVLEYEAAEPALNAVPKYLKELRKLIA